MLELHPCLGARDPCLLVPISVRPSNEALHTPAPPKLQSLFSCPPPRCLLLLPGDMFLYGSRRLARGYPSLATASFPDPSWGT